MSLACVQDAVLSSATASAITDLERMLELLENLYDVVDS